MRLALVLVLCCGCRQLLGFDPASQQAPTDSSGDDSVVVDGIAGAGFVRQLAVGDANVSGGPHIDFPVLVKLTDTWLRDVMHGGDVARADGADLYFTANKAGTIPLAFEVESYSPALGSLVAWVKIPLLVAGTNLFVHYGDASITTSREDVQAVWSAGYAMVMHMTATPLADATGKSTAFDALTSGTTAGQIGDGFSFDGVDDRILAGSVDAIDNVFSGGGTAEGWIFADTFGENGFGRVFDKGHTNGWSFTLNNQTAVQTVAFVHGTTSGGASPFGEWNGPNNVVTPNAWHHVAVVFNSSSVANNPTFYVDGAALLGIDEVVTPTGTMDSDATIVLHLGNRDANDRTFDGVLDELRLSTVARNAGWLSTQFRNQSDPVGFLVVSDPL